MLQNLSKQYSTIAYQAGYKLTLLLVTLMMLASPAQAIELAGKVQFVVGEVNATSTAGITRNLRKGDHLFSGDTIKSGLNGSAQLIFKDLSRMVVRVNTEFVIEEYHYDAKNSQKSISIFSLIGGALRSITGLIGKANKESVLIRTSIATVGIRGTDHEVIHITPELDGGKLNVEIGTYDKVYQGATILRSANSAIDLKLNQVGFVGGSPGKIARPIRIKELPRSIENLIVKKVPLQAKTIKREQPATSSKTVKTDRINRTDPVKINNTRIIDTSKKDKPLTAIESTVKPKLINSIEPSSVKLPSPVISKPVLKPIEVQIPKTNLLIEPKIIEKPVVLEPVKVISPILEPATRIKP